MFSFYEILRVLMLTKNKKINFGTSDDAHARLQAVIQSQRIEIENQKNADEKQILRAALSKAHEELKELKCAFESSVKKDENPDLDHSQLASENAEHNQNIPTTWKAPSEADAETLRKRIEQEEEALALRTPLVSDGTGNDCELESKGTSNATESGSQSLAPSTKIASAHRLVREQEKTIAPGFKDFLKNKAGITQSASAASLPSVADVSQPRVNDLVSEIECSLDQLETNINKRPAEVDYDLDFTVEHCEKSDHADFDEDSIPVLTEKIAGKAVAPEDVLTQTSPVASSFSMPMSALLSSWLLSISRKAGVAGAVQRTYLLEDEHENRNLHLFSDVRSTGLSRSHCLTRLNDWGSEIDVPQPGVFHVFRPKFVSSISKDSILLTRPQDSACFYKWVTPLSARGNQTVLQAFVERQLPYLHETISKQITDLWKVAREVKSTGIQLSEASCSDLSAKNRVYEATRVLLTRPLLSCLFAELGGNGALLIDHLAGHDTIKKIRWEDMPWFDYPPQIVLFHLLAEVAHSKSCSLSSARIMGLLDKILMLSPAAETSHNNLMYVRLLEEHSRVQAGSEDSSLKEIFSSESTQIISSEAIDVDIYENPGLEVFIRDDGLSMVRGPLITRLVEHFSDLKENLKELGLFRPELDLICREIQAK